MFFKRALVSRPRIELRQRENESERAGIVAIVKSHRTQIQSGQRTSLVTTNDASGLFVTPGIVVNTLKPSQCRQNGVCHLSSVEHRGLPGRRQCVASPQGLVQGDSCGGR